MGYLRGTVKRERAIASANAKDNAFRLNWLERKVQRRRQELQDRHVTGTHVSTASNTNVLNFSPTSALIASSGFRSKIIGDQWYNHSLHAKIRGLGDTTASGPGVTSIRAIIYVPRKQGTTFVPVSFCETVDKSRFRVYAERTSVLQSNGGDCYVDLYANLKDLITWYDTSSTTLEKGEIKLCVIWKSTVAGTNMEVCYQHKFYNK